VSDFQPNPAWRALGLRLLIAVVALFALAIIAPILGAIILTVVAWFS